MTAPDTIATYIADKGLYMDNSNVWFITINNSPEDIMKAITCIINSTAFSVLAKAGANPQLNNYYKFNKQFLSPVPFPNIRRNLAIFYLKFHNYRFYTLRQLLF